MPMTKRIATLMMLFCGTTSWVTSAFAQESVIPLRYNPALINHHQPSGNSVRSAKALPFIDDFSYPGPDPDSTLWINDGAFLNNTFPKDPVTYGVLTLDGLKGDGTPYDSVSYNFSSIGSADTVTSIPILLGALSPADSVYLSFFYQPGGLGDVPNTQIFNLFNYGVNFGDSLVLEFKSSTGVWQHAWSRNGSSLQPFKQVMVRIYKPQYFFDDFQFRFRNYASLIGNYDQWHLDYVRLNSGRNKGDTLINDVAIQLYPTTILKNYQAMPWRQFQNYQENEKAPSHQLAIKNNFNAIKNTSYFFDAIERESASQVFTSVIQSQNVSASDTAQVNFASFDIQNFFTDTVIISTKYIVGASGDINTRNDSLIREQVFSNYMAYDDGSAEATYRLQGSPASLAQQYIVNEPDTLRGIEIHFSNTDNNMGQNLFSLIIWSSLAPEDTLYRADFLKPKFVKELNGFSFYRLNRPVVVTDTFYIGFQQSSITTDLKTDLGFDLNNDASSHLKYNLNNGWIDSQFPGAVMMRPVMGQEIPYQVGIAEPTSGAGGVLLWPNPVHDKLTVSYEGTSPCRYQIFDNAGRLLISAAGSNVIDVNMLPQGFYLLQVVDLKTGKKVTRKFIKQ